MAQFQNQATLSYAGGTVTSNITVGELLDSLTVTKTAVTETYGQHDAVVYILGISNAGSLALTGLTVTDNLGAYTLGDTTLYPLSYTPGSLRMYVNGVPAAASPTVTAGPPLAIEGVDLPAGGSVLLIYQTTVNRYAPLAGGSTIVNTAELTDGAAQPRAVLASAQETITAQDGPVLSISKSVYPLTVTGEGPVTYTFVIQNAGSTPATAEDAIVVTDIFDPVLEDLTVTYNGEAWTEGADYSYDEAAGSFATVAGRVTVPAASYTQDPATGVWTVEPGVSVLVVSGAL